jgi:SAM-dependent methyltransferase
MPNPDIPAQNAAGPVRIFTPEYYARMRELEAQSWWNAGMRDIAASMLELAPLPPAGLLLDVGCGSGQTMAWFAGLHRGWQTIGLDVAPEGLAAARARNNRVLRASALELPFPAAAVDLVVTLDVLQHLPLGTGDRTALSEIGRVLKPGGHVFLRTNAQSLPHAADDPTYQFHKYRPDELRAKLESAGFEVIRLGRVNALLGLAEIPRELRAGNAHHSYHGLLAEPRAEARWQSGLKRSWLRFEGRAVRLGGSWPLGRTIVALCRWRGAR